MDVALDELNEALKLDPNNAKAYNIMGLVYTVLRDDRKAEQSFQRALALAPQDSEIRENWGWYLCTHGRAKSRSANSNRHSAIRCIVRPEIALINAAGCSASIGETRSAETYYRRALAASANNARRVRPRAAQVQGSARLEEARTG